MLENLSFGLGEPISIRLHPMRGGPGPGQARGAVTGRPEAFPHRVTSGQKFRGTHLQLSSSHCQRPAEGLQGQTSRNRKDEGGLWGGGGRSLLSQHVNLPGH